MQTSSPPTPMMSVGSSEARAHLPKLLARVAKGERILITRRGVPIALLTQPSRQTTQDVGGVIARMKALRWGNALGDRLSARPGQ